MNLTYRIVCIECGHALENGSRRPGSSSLAEERELMQSVLRGCPACLEKGLKSNFTVKLDLTHSELDANSLMDPTASGLWRWRKLLPVQERFQVSLGEGLTPLIRLERFGQRIGLSNLYVKDESQNPTWSYKDRLCAVAVSNALEIGAEVVTVSSTGNHGAATAAYAARAGLPCVVFTLASVPDVMKTLMQAYGAYVVALESAEDRWRLMAAMADQYGWYPTSGFQSPPIGSNPFGIEGYKTIAFETWNDMGGAPDWMVVPTGYGDGLAGTWKGWRELHELGCIEKAPKMLAAELNGSLEQTLRRDERKPIVVEAPESPAFSINAPIGTQQSLAAIRQSGGRAVSVQSEDLILLQRQLAEQEGIYAEAASLVPLAAVRRLAAEGAIGRDEVVVAVITSTGLKDPGATAAHLPDVPVIAPDVHQLIDALSGVYEASIEL